METSASEPQVNKLEGLTGGAGVGSEKDATETRSHAYEANSTPIYTGSVTRAVGRPRVGLVEILNISVGVAIKPAGAGPVQTFP